MSLAGDSAARPHITAVVVTHDGETWLPTLLSALAQSTRAPDRVVAVDTGSVDSSRSLLEQALGASAVLTAPRATGFGAAVAAALAHTSSSPSTTGGDEWVWLLHDDCAPAPDALRQLLDVGTRDGGVAAVGCRIRGWPRARRLLEVGVSITGTGHRETGLEPGEYDQGQHDEALDVLGVSSAGMLIRRSVWDDLDGFDPRLPLFRDDVDFGWRVARSGGRVVFAPQAVLHHAEASARGVRDISNTARRPHRADRRAALFTVLANCSAVALPFQYVRLMVGSVLRALGYLIGKLPGVAYDELGAMASVLGRPWRLVAARAHRRTTATVSARSVRALLPPWWTPYGNGLDALLMRFSDSLRQTATTVTATTRRLRSGRADAAALESGPVSDDAVNLLVGAGPRAQIAAHPLLFLTSLLVIAAFFGSRGLFGGGFVQGGALWPAPDGVGEWWRLYAQSWHPVGLGSGTATAPYVGLLALPATILAGKAWLVVDLLMLFAVPLAGIGAYLAARRLVAGVAARVWMAAMYALLPVVSGAVTTGHLGTVVAIIVLPWVARSALALLDARPGRHWRAAWATGLGLSVAAAFAPVLWPLAVVMTLVGLVTRSIRARVVQVAVALVVPVLLLAPWSLRIFAHPHLLLTEAGAVDAAGASLAHAWLLPLGRLSAPGDAPWWLTVGVLVGALVALLRRDRRAPVAAAWVVAAVALAAAAVMSQRLLEVPGTDVQAPAWLGVPVVVAQAAAIVAVGLAADGVARFIGSGSFGWRQPLGAATAVVALLAPVAGLLWWVVSAPQGELGRADAVPLPAYMIDAMSDGQQRVLVVDTQGQVMTYRVFAGDGFRLGDESVRPRQSARDVTGLVTDMLAEGHPQDVRQLNDQAIGYVVLTSPAKPRAITELDSLPGLTRASSSGAVFSGWKVNAHGHKVTDPPSGADGPLDSHRPWWLALEALCWLVTIVLAAPGIRNWRAELETDESEGQT